MNVAKTLLMHKNEKDAFMSNENILALKACSDKV